MADKARTRQIDAISMASTLAQAEWGALHASPPRGAPRERHFRARVSPCVVDV